MNRFAYAKISLSNMFHKLNPHQKITVTAGGESQIRDIEVCSSLLFANIRSVMGMGISNRYGSPFDDTIECIVAKNVFAYSAMLLQLNVPLCLPTLIGSSKMWEVAQIPEGTYLQIDGDPHPEITSKKFRIRPIDHVKMIVGS